MAYSYTDNLIPARKAMILWNPGPEEDGDGWVGVVLHPHARDCPDRALEFSDGACTAGWEDASDEVMLRKIQSLAWHIIRQHGVDADLLHTALLQIDLYNQFWKK
jgi:hypothetical protein